MCKTSLIQISAAICDNFTHFRFTTAKSPTPAKVTPESVNRYSETLMFEVCNFDELNYIHLFSTLDDFKRWSIPPKMKYGPNSEYKKPEVKMENTSTFQRVSED